MKNISLKSISSSIARTFVKYNLTLFIVVLVGGLSVAVLMLNDILQQTSSSGAATTTTSISTFDQVTIDRVRLLHTSNDVLPVFTLPAGRVNPFAE